jgi:hypothetical protein
MYISSSKTEVAASTHIAVCYLTIFFAHLYSNDVIIVNVVDNGNVADDGNFVLFMVLMLLMEILLLMECSY